MDKDDKHFLIFMLITYMVGMGCLKFIIDSNTAKKQFIQKGIELGCIEYKLVDTKSGNIELRIIDTKKEELSKWLEIPLFISSASDKLEVSLPNLYVGSGSIYTYPVYRMDHVATVTLNDCVDRQARDGHRVQAEETR